ncbi:MAG: hypothetical protein L0Y37_00125 [Bacteroidales bacterium]|nr:hypothetical protein [Bacteroidales bacterium]
MHLSSLRDDAPSELSAPAGAVGGHHTYMHSHSPQGDRRITAGGLSRRLWPPTVAEPVA